MTDRKPASPKRGAPAKRPLPAKPVEEGSPASPGGLASRFDWQWLIMGIVILGVSLFLTVSQLGDPGASTGLFSGPMGMALNIGGIVAGAWVLFRAYRR